MRSNDKLKAKLKRCQTIEDAQEIMTLHLGQAGDLPAATAMILCRHDSKSAKPFAEQIAKIAPLKEGAIDINHSRFNRLIEAKTANHFISSFKTCLAAIDYDCSRHSIEQLIQAFFTEADFVRNKRDSWRTLLAYEFYRHQPTLD